MEPAQSRDLGCVLLSRVLVLAGLGFSLLFLYTGIDKWSDLAGFERVVVSHGLIGADLAGPASVALAAAEVGVGALGLLLVLGTGIRSLSLVLVLQAALFLIFAVYAGLLSPNRRRNRLHAGAACSRRGLPTGPGSSRGVL